jgi:ABC-type branched-subunit amino acid transport system substrate-binding protein
MHRTSRHGFEVPVIAVIGLVLTVSGLCLGDLAAAATTGTPAAKCVAPPIKVMVEAGIDVNGGFPEFAQPEVPSGALAAAAAENRTCRLGRPVQIITCDDHSTMAGAVGCAQQAGAQQVVAVVGGSGPWASKMLPTLNQAGIPLVGCACAGPGAYPIAFSYPAHVTLAAALGAKKLALLTDLAFAPSVPALEQQAAKVGVTIVAVITVPFSATDLSPYVAQALAAGADSLLPAVIQQAQRVAAIKALHEQGVHIGDGFTVVNGPILVTPAQVKQLGAAAEGVAFLGDTWSTTDQSNPGIKQYFKELREARQPTDTASEGGVLAWSMTHVAIGFLTRAKTKDANGIVQVLNTHGAINRPELVPQDFTRNDAANMTQSPFRNPGTTQFATQVQDGKIIMLAKRPVPMLDPYTLQVHVSRSTKS